MRIVAATIGAVATKAAMLLALTTMFALVGLFARASMDPPSVRADAITEFRFSELPRAQAPDPRRAAASGETGDLGFNGDPFDAYDADEH